MEVIVQAVTAGIALAALVVSIVVAKRQTEVQERLAAVEEARRADEVAARSRAQVTASIQRMPGDGRWPGQQVLVLRNEGAAVARQVLATVDERPGTPKPIGLDDLSADLQPRQEMPFLLPVSLGDEPVLRLTVRWTDQLGDHTEPYTLQLL